MQIIRPDETTRLPPHAAALGFFDGVHLGHAAVVGAACRFAHESGLRSMAVTFADMPGRGRLLMTDDLKEEALAGLGVDTLVYLDYGRVHTLLARAFLADMLRGSLGARAVFCGFNYRFGAGAAAGTQELLQMCGELSLQAFVQPPVCVGGAPVSATRIRSLLEEGDAAAAEALMGRSFAVRGEVLHGKRLGRTLGAPTINQCLPPRGVTPRFGVYAATALVDGEWLPAVTNVGVNPTTGTEAARIESFLPGFSGDLYGRVITVRLHAFLRPEERFDSLEALRDQIFADTQRALALLSHREPAAARTHPCPG